MSAEHEKAMNLMRETGFHPETSNFPNPQNLVIQNIHRGEKEKGRDIYVYAELVDRTTGETVIRATLDYIVSRVMGDKLGKE
jgi:hypothetical protein